jgi:PAS domain S-box-containing protein
MYTSSSGTPADDTFPLEVELSNGADSASTSAWYRRAFQEAPTGMAIVGLDGRYLRVNHAFCDMLGYVEEELLATDISAVTHPGDTDRSLHSLGEMLAGEIDQVDMVKRYVRKGGSVLWGHVHSSVVRNSSGEALYFVSQVRDITESLTTRFTLEQRGAVLEAVAFAADRFLAGSDWEEEIGPVLAKMGRATGADRVTLWEGRCEGDDVVANLRFEWTAPGVPPIVDSEREEVSLRSRFPRYADAILRGDAMLLRRSALTGEERTALERVGAQSILGIPVMVEGRLWGHLGFHVGDSEREWSHSVVDAVRVAAHLVGAAIAQHRSLTTLRDFARRGVVVREEEGRRISRRIHDELGQSLTALKIDLSSLRRSGDDTVRIDRMMALADDTIARVREIAAELRPPVLDDLGLTGTIEWVTEEFEKRTGIECELRLPEDIVIDEKRSIALYRILQEALANIVRHADARRVIVILERSPDAYVLEVRDDGRGIPAEVLGGGQALGIVGMRERAESWEGELEIESRRGQGTLVRARLPIDDTSAQVRP